MLLAAARLIVITACFSVNAVCSNYYRQRQAKLFGLNWFPHGTSNERH